MAPASAARPFILVLAGVNVSGKSSVGGAMLEAHGLTWFNPDTFSRELVAHLGMPLEQPNAISRQYGPELL